MDTTVSSVAFFLGAVVSLGASWVLVSRLERVGKRLGFSESLLGVVAALTADAPEITASVTALAHHQQSVSAGVVMGSNVFNLAVLLGVGAVVAGRIALHRRVVMLGGVIAIFVSIVCLLTVAGVLSPIVALVLVMVVLLTSFTVSASSSVLEHVALPDNWKAWIRAAVHEEEDELMVAIHPRAGSGGDAVVAAIATAVVVVASVAMERGASSLGTRFGVADAVVGGLVLAAVTSLPNAVAGIYLARRGRGAAALSTSLNSNAINVAAGFLLPTAIVGLSRAGGPGILTASSYLALTGVIVVLAFVGRGLRRGSGWFIVSLYAAFVIALLAIT
ncbi:MAG TPA: hypothetical protein VNG12_12025 [Acidimicrobiales bacterium]|nr:hypothetical protein [Acidimicrobiales bacterium]